MKKIKIDLSRNSNNLIPAIIQDDKRGDILMLGYMNKKAFEMTKRKGYVFFWSRKRGRLWMKGEESGNELKVKKIFLDCDADSLLIRVEPIGRFICHKGRRSCFFQQIHKI